jgi:hypothetical protein
MIVVTVGTEARPDCAIEPDNQPITGHPLLWPSS